MIFILCFPSTISTVSVTVFFVDNSWFTIQRKEKMRRSWIILWSNRELQTTTKLLQICANITLFTSTMKSLKTNNRSCRISIAQVLAQVKRRHTNNGSQIQNSLKYSSRAFLLCHFVLPLLFVVSRLSVKVNEVRINLTFRSDQVQFVMVSNNK